MNTQLLFLAGFAGLLFMAALLAFAYFRGVALLQFYQQEEYDSDRFIKWLVRKRAFDKRASLVTLVSFIAWYNLKDLNPAVLNLTFYFLIIAALIVGTRASQPKKDAVKKPLVMTARAQRIFYTYLLLIGVYFAGVLGSFQETNITALMAAFFLYFQWPPLFLVAANFILKPVEDFITSRYRKEAEEKMAGLNPTIIAVTGSFGKTSIKHILSHILAASAPTLATPGSVNTVMGVVRIIRENLEPRHKYFIVEMGAYGEGSIKQLCRLTPPDLGIISAIGHAHFERFKSLQTVFRAKFELAEDLKLRGGRTIVNASAVDRAALDNYLKTNPNLILCGTGGGGFKTAYTLKSFKQGKDGLAVTLEISWQGKKKALDLDVPLYGPHQAANLMLAVAAALELGLHPDVVRAALKTMPQVRHRLEVTKPKSGPVIIDDAYNSNPAGFSSALDLVKTLKSPKGRAILVTPGMVELGRAHDAEHAKIGEKAAAIADVALVVGPERLKSFIAAFQKNAQKGAILATFPRQSDAEKWVADNARTGDVVLFENNLPDLYEAEIRF